MPDALELFARPPANCDNGQLSNLLSETFREAGLMLHGESAFDAEAFTGLYEGASLSEDASDASGWLVDVGEVERAQVAPTLPDASEFAQDKLAQVLGMEWLSHVQAILVAPTSSDPDQQRLHLRGLTEQLRLQADEVPAFLFPRVKDFVPCKVLGMDTETTGLDTRVRYGYDGKLMPGSLLVGLTVAPRPDCGYYLPVRHTGEDGVNNWNAEVIAGWVEELLAEFLTVFHNAAYDLEVLALNGVTRFRPFPYCCDTQILSFIFNSNEITHGLKPVSERVLERKMIEISQLFVGVGGIKKNAYIAFEHLQATQAVVYGASDSMNTLGLFQWFSSQPPDSNVFLKQPIPVSVDHKLIDVIRGMVRTGLPVNFTYNFFALKDGLHRKHILQRRINEAAGREINIGSGPQLNELLFKQFRIPPLPGHKVGANGNYSLDEDVLDKMAEAYPDVEILNMIVLYRKLAANCVKIYAKVITNSWVDAFQPWMRVKLAFTQTRIVTGRLASAGNSGKTRATVREGKKGMKHVYVRGAWDAELNAQGIPGGPFRTAKLRTVRKLPAAAGLDLQHPYPKEVEDDFIQTCASL